MKQNSLIRTLYLYFFSMLGLILVVVGGIRFIDMGLKAFVFPKAEQDIRFNYLQPPFPYSIEKLSSPEQVNGLSEDEIETLKRFLTEYKQWQEQKSQIDPLTARRQREASINLSLILVGLPLYLYHWRIIKRESQRRTANDKQ
ncbi:hypothetical protein J7L09_00340 [bacterium]|nr:hypothetical protein [bacterium]